MNRLGVATVVLVLATFLGGCGSSDEALNVPKSATEGGNVVNDPELKKQLMGPSGAQQQGAPPTAPGQ